MNSIEYHLTELKISLDRNDKRRILPRILDSDKVILDIGCGIGQTFIALNCKDRICIGIDNDADAIRYGIQRYGHKIQFILSDAQHIPLPAKTVHLVFSRVSLPYMNIPKVLKEIRRVLQNGGRVWMTLHDRSVATNFLKEAMNLWIIHNFIYAIYILINGYILKYFGVVFPYFDGNYESWQDTGAMKKLLIRNGFKVYVHMVGRHTVIEGRLS